MLFSDTSFTGNKFLLTIGSRSNRHGPGGSNDANHADHTNRATADANDYQSNSSRLLKYVLSHPQLFPIIKITSGLFFLGLYFWVLEGFYYHTVEMIKWNFYFSVVPEFIFTAYFTIVLLEVCRLLQIRSLVNNIMK